MPNEVETRINAEPTKRFFVDMLTRDVALEQAILDLVDNSVDGAKRLRPASDASFDGLSIRLSFNAERFRILDNCGGFDRETARDYAFRFGRASNAPKTPGSIGQFGIGMKRALFKFGKYFSVRSATANDKWAIEVDVNEWEEKPDWHFDWVDFGLDRPIGAKRAGTEIVVTQLRNAVAQRFSTTQFMNSVIALIKSKHRQFVARGLSIRVNGRHVDATDVFLLVGDKLQPGVRNFALKDPDERDVLVSIKCGLGSSNPRDAGWFVICNGRVILEADRRAVTGWRLLEDDSNRLLIPGFHNQYARFRGIVTFDSQDSERVPWNTTKTDVDQDSPVWQRTFPQMIEMMRPVIDFLDDLDKDIDENTRDGSGLYQFVNKVPLQSADTLTARGFSAPKKDDVQYGPRTVKIQYSKPTTDVDFLKDALDLTSARAVGEKTFDLILKRQRS